ncbi:MAG: trehalose-phosphatase [Methanobacteriota archaeon]
MNSVKSAFNLTRSGYDAVIFDLDGVLTKTAKMHAEAWKKLFDQYLKKHSKGRTFKPFSDDDYHRYVDGKPRYEGVKSFLASRGIKLTQGGPDDSPSKETNCGLGNKKNQIFYAHLKKKGVEVYESSIDLVHQLKSRGFKIAVVSSSRNCSVVLDAAKIADLFDTKVDGQDLERLGLKGKPEPDLFIEAVASLGIEPGRTAVVEDAIAGVQAGRRGKFGAVIGVDRNGMSQVLRENGADVVVKDLSEIKIGIGIEDLPHVLESFQEIEARINNKRIAVFLDYDGTLTQIVSRPEEATLPEDMRNTLSNLVKYQTVAIISGRDLKDVKKLVGIEDIHYAGSHGFDIAGPKGTDMEHQEAREFIPALDRAEQMLKKRLNKVKNAMVERKKFSIAIHYRNVNDKDVGAVEETVDQVLKSSPKLRKSYGKKVYELQPNIDWNKGKALLWLLEALDLNHHYVVPIYVGDDITDEDAFKVLKNRGIGIVVGKGSRTTEARYRLKDPSQVKKFIQKIISAANKKDPWSFVYRGLNPDEEGLREALCTLGNGYFATRGAAPESDADGIHYPGTYLAGGYNRLKTKIAGKTIENEDLVNLPNWLSFKFRIPGESWFDLRDVKILDYYQELDLKNGVLLRKIIFRDHKGRQTKLTSRCLVHMGNMHVAALETTLTAENWSGQLEIRSALDGGVVNSGVERYKGLNKKHLEPLETKEINNDTIFLKVRTKQSKINIVQAARTQVFKDEKLFDVKKRALQNDDFIAHEFKVEICEGSSIAIEKIVTLYTSNDRGISECGLAAENAIKQVGCFEDLLKTHTSIWKHLWDRFELRIKVSNGWHRTEQILHLYTFHLLQTISRNTKDLDVGVPSRGWHGEAYRGHVFWDELFILPVFNLRIPEIARALLLYRFKRLNQARLAAKKAGYRGAMYPWQSGSNGREESQQLHLNPKTRKWIPDNSQLQRHVNAAIAYNVWQYYQVTRNLEFLSSYGAEMILEIARFWASIATYNKHIDRYEILGVMGPDEYHDGYPSAEKAGIDNNAYTNIMAVWVLCRALELHKLFPENRWRELCELLGLDKEEFKRWEEISRKMRVVFHEDGIISQFEGYDQLEEFDWEDYRKKYGNIQRLDRVLNAEGDTPNRYKVSKQADVLMLFYLFSSEELSGLFKRLGYSFEHEIILKNIAYYLARTSNGSSLSRVVHSWVEASLNRERSWRLFIQALETDIGDIQGGTTREGIHLGAMAGCLDIVRRCYAGIETRGDILWFNPMLPEELNKLILNIYYRGHWLKLDITSDKLKIKSLPSIASPIKIEVKDKIFELKEGETKEIML